MLTIILYFQLLTVPDLLLQHLIAFYQKYRNTDINERFNLIKTSKGQDIIFSSKPNKRTHPSLYFKYVTVKLTQVQKRFGLHLDNKLPFRENTTM